MALDIRSALPDSASHLMVGSVSHHIALTGLCNWHLRNYCQVVRLTSLLICRLKPVLLGNRMRRSCRLSNKHEHRLLKQAEAVAADAAAAEAVEEAAAVYPSTVTKAIAGLTTPSLPSPSMFPDDWRMVHEYLNDGQVRHLAQT